MDKQIVDFINSQRICVFAIEMLDGSPHAATLHFAINQNPLVFFFKTDKSYKKSEALLNKEISRATVVVGFNESNMKTFQADGQARIINEREMELFNKIYYGKFLDKEKKDNDPNAVFFLFTPTWWRFTDWHGPNGKFIISSDNI